jgi:hypothetical protein
MTDSEEQAQRGRREWEQLVLSALLSGEEDEEDDDDMDFVPAEDGQDEDEDDEFHGEG